MIRKIMILFLLIISISIIGQVVFNEQTFVYDSNSNDSVRWLEQTNDGLLILGFSDSEKGSGVNDFLLRKTDYNGNLSWEKYYGGIGDDRGYVVKETKDGIILGGAMLSKNYDQLRNNGAWDALLIKLDKNGNVQWKQNYGKSGSETIRDVIPTYDDGYMFCGYTFSEDYENYHGGKDFYIVKTDSAGEVIWKKIMGGRLYDMPYSIIETDSGEYVIAGYTFSHDGDLEEYENHGGGDFWIIKLDYFGNLVWSKVYGGSGWDEARDVIETRDRGFLVAGVSSSKNGNVDEGNGKWDAWLLKLDKDGEMEWEKTYGGSSYDKVFSVYQLRDRGFVAAGFSKSDDGDVSRNSGKSDMWVFRTDRDGDLIWEHSFDTQRPACAEMIVKSNDGRFTVVWGEFSGNESFAGDNGRRYQDFLVTRFIAN